MSLEIKKRIGNFKEIRFLSKSQFLVADLKRSIPRFLKSKLLRLAYYNYIIKEAEHLSQPLFFKIYQSAKNPYTSKCKDFCVVF